MFRTFLIASASALCLAGGAVYAAGSGMNDITVKTDLSALKNPEAAKFYANLPTDLTNAIAERLGPEQKEALKQSQLVIDINAVELANTWQAANDFSKSELTGIVHQNSESASHSKNYEMTVKYDNVVAYLPPGADPTALAHDSQAYYKGMIDAFATGVVQYIR